MFAYGIFKVIYAPRKAFREIIQNPKYFGPILIMVLFIIANSGFFYLLSSKTYVEQTVPMSKQLDEWTQNSTLWNSTSGTTIEDNHNDYISGTVYGKKSIEFSIVNSTQISMQLSNIGPVNCTGSKGYRNVSFRIKQIDPEVTPENVTFYLFSASPSFFYYNFTHGFSNSTIDVWSNFTIPLETADWLKSSTDADWGNITGLRLEFAWPENSNITLLIDGLFFRGVFKLFTENDVSLILNVSMRGLTQFVIRWVILGGLIFLMIKGLGGKSVWKPALIVVGFALVTMCMQAVISLIVFANLRPLYYPFEFVGGVKGESEVAYNKILEETWLYSQVYGYLQIIVYAWTIVLCSIAVRLLTEFSWTKTVLIASVAYFVSILAESFILAF